MKPENNLYSLFKSRRRKNKEENETLEALREKNEFEKKDIAALIIAAMTTIFPVVLVILILYYVITMLVFG